MTKKETAYIPEGSYMEAQDVYTYLCTKLGRYVLAEMVEDLCMAECGSDDGIEYYKTEDLKFVIPAQTFREMECEVTTYVYGEFNF